MKCWRIKLVSDARGATAIEYGLIVALIVIVVVAGISQLGTQNGGVWGNVASKTESALPTS